MVVRNTFIVFFLSTAALFFQSCKDEDTAVPQTKLQLSTIHVGTYTLDPGNAANNTEAPNDKPIVATFSAALDTASARQAIQLKQKDGAIIPIKFSYLDNNKTFSISPSASLESNRTYELIISNQLRGSAGEIFEGLTISFTTIPSKLEITSLKINGNEVITVNPITDVPQPVTIEVTFDAPVDPATIAANHVIITGANGNPSRTLSLSEGNTKLTITTNETLRHISKTQLWLSNEIKGADGEVFQTFIKLFYTAVDPSQKLPQLSSDDELLTLVQQQTFKYFWDLGDPNSGLALERNDAGNIVTTGGSGFGIMSIVVGIERNFITRDQGVARMKKIVSFLENADRFHGAWSHWVNGSTGHVIPFGTKDDGGDLVETSFLMQGLLTFRQYLQSADTVGNNLINRITTLYNGVEWDWYRKNNENVLYWHWSPDYDWQMNFPLYGYFEEQVTYVLAASSPTHGIPKIVYANGYGKNGNIVKNNLYYGYKLPLESPAPLFWTQYSYLGLDPHFTDDYASYWEQNVNATLINRAYCIANPKHYVGYGEDCWGLTASDNENGYSAHSPTNDLGVITPTAALSAFPYTPTESMQALKFFYYTLGDRLWGPYGFYDAFNLTSGWTASSTLAIDQGPIIVMIENYRSGLLWNLFMSSPEVKDGVATLGFTY
jgi:hypothetical protein